MEAMGERRARAGATLAKAKGGRASEGYWLVRCQPPTVSAHTPSSEATGAVTRPRPPRVRLSFLFPPVVHFLAADYDVLLQQAWGCPSLPRRLTACGAFVCPSKELQCSLRRRSHSRPLREPHRNLPSPSLKAFCDTLHHPTGNRQPTRLCRAGLGNDEPVRHPTISPNSLHPVTTSRTKSLAAPK